MHISTFDFNKLQHLNGIIDIKFLYHFINVLLYNFGFNFRKKVLVP
jgi:hypothetical protein